MNKTHGYSSGGITKILKNAGISIENMHYCKECANCACLDYLNDTKPPFKHMAAVKAANKMIGNHWFGRETMGFFGTRLESGIIKNRFFVTSDTVPSDSVPPTKAFSIRFICANGAIETVGELWGHETLAKALGAINVYGKGLY